MKRKSMTLFLIFLGGIAGLFIKYLGKVALISETTLLGYSLYGAAFRQKKSFGLFYSYTSKVIGKMLMCFLKKERGQIGIIQMKFIGNIG